MPDLDHIRINQLSPAGTAWLADLLARIETLNIDVYAEAMAEDVELVLANGTATLTGRHAVRSAFRDGWQNMSFLLHHEENIYGEDDHFVHESNVDYRDTAGLTWSARSTAWIDRDRNGRLVRARIYGEASP